MRYLKISKELIRTVLEKETENLQDDFTFDIIDNYIIFADDGECMFEVNVYEFIYKCKEWALKKGFKIYSSCKTSSISRDGTLLWISPGENNEIETIFKACEWILKEAKNNI